MKSKTGHAMALIGYGRMGKSSILAEVERVLDGNEKTVIVNFDVQHNLGDPSLFFRNLSHSIFDAYVKKLGSVEKIKAKRIDPISRIMSALQAKKIREISMEVSADVDTGKMRILPKMGFADKEKSYRDMFEAVFAAINAIADDSKMKFVIILDEFQEMIKLKRYKGLKNIVDMFGGVIQQRSKNVSYITCGSRVHMLNRLLQDAGSPLFQHFDRLPIGEMGKRDATKLFCTYFKDRHNRSCGQKLANSAYDLVGGHPYYLMALAEAWRPKRTLSEIFSESISSPLGALGLYAQYVLSESLATASGGPLLYSILVELAKSDVGMSYKTIGKKLDIHTTRITFYMQELTKADLVGKEDKAYFVRDMVVREFLRCVF